MNAEDERGTGVEDGVDRPALRFATPRKLPNPKSLPGRVVVLDIAFAGVQGGGFDKVTRKFLDGLGDRLALWVDHHDHERHAEFSGDPRFYLRRKSEHGACPEMITPELVRRAGQVGTVVCHTDFDGFASAAKWLRGGEEPYPGCDDDARAIDTRLGTPSAFAIMVDRALRARPQDERLQVLLVEYLASGLAGDAPRRRLEDAAAELLPIERETERAARSYRVYSRRAGGTAAYVDISSGFGRLDKTHLLLLGQERANVAVVVDAMNVSVAAPFDSGLDFLALFGLEGGMPTRVSMARNSLDFVVDRLGIDFVA